MQSVYDLRRENLRQLSKQWGGPTSLSRKLGHANGSYLAQLIGPNPSRDVSEKVAREIETKLGLPVAWMDAEHSASPRIDDELLAECARAVAAAIRDAGVKADPERYALLVGLAYDFVRLTGRIDEAHIVKLTRLLR